jgi:hypothetical protein
MISNSEKFKLVISPAKRKIPVFVINIYGLLMDPEVQGCDARMSHFLTNACTKSILN